MMNIQQEYHLSNLHYAHDELLFFGYLSFYLPKVSDLALKNSIDKNDFEIDPRETHHLIFLSLCMMPYIEQAPSCIHPQR